MGLERAAIAEWQGASEDQKFVAKPTQSNMSLFFTNGISLNFKYLMTRQALKHLGVLALRMVGALIKPLA